MNDRLLTVDQVGEYLGLHRDTVYAMVRSGRLPALQLGGRKASWRISESDLQGFIAARKAAGPGANGAGESLEQEQADARARFERQQENESTAFMRQQEQRKSDFEAEQIRTRQSNNHSQPSNSGGNGA